MIYWLSSSTFPHKAHFLSMLGSLFLKYALVGNFPNLILQWHRKNLSCHDTKFPWRIYHSIMCHFPFHMCHLQIQPFIWILIIAICRQFVYNLQLVIWLYLVEDNLFVLKHTVIWLKIHLMDIDIAAIFWRHSVGDSYCWQF